MQFTTGIWPFVLLIWPLLWAVQALACPVLAAPFAYGYGYYNGKLTENYQSGSFLYNISYIGPMSGMGFVICMTWITYAQLSYFYLVDHTAAAFKTFFILEGDAWSQDNIFPNRLRFSDLQVPSFDGSLEDLALVHDLCFKMVMVLPLSYLSYQSLQLNPVAIHPTSNNYNDTTEGSEDQASPSPPRSFNSNVIQPLDA